VCHYYAEGGITAVHCPQSTNFSNGPCIWVTYLRCITNVKLTLCVKAVIFKHHTKKASREHASETLLHPGTRWRIVVSFKLHPHLFLGKECTLCSSNNASWIPVPFMMWM